MTQTPSMHLLENNNLVEVAMAAQQHSHPQQQQNHQHHQSQVQQQRKGLTQQKQKQSASPTNNNTIEAWRSMQGGAGIGTIVGHQWWSPPNSVHQEQLQREASPIAQVSSQVQNLVSGSMCQVLRHQQQQRGQQQEGQQIQTVQSDIDQPLDFSVGSLQQQRFQSRVRSMQERLQQDNRIHDNNNGMSERARKISKNTVGEENEGRGASSRRSYSPASEASTTGSEDEAVSTGESPLGTLRGAENDSSETVADRTYGKVWRGNSEVTWQTEQCFKRISPLNASCATATTPPTISGTTVATGGGAPAHPHLSPSIAAPVTTPDHRSAVTLRANQGISPGT